MNRPYLYLSFQDCLPLPGQSIAVRDPITQKHLNMRGHWFPEDFQGGIPFNETAEWRLLYPPEGQEKTRYLVKEGRPWRVTRLEHC